MLSIIESNNNINPIIGEAVNLFFTPVSFDVLTSLSIEHQALEKQIKETHQIITKSEVSGVLSYFFDGNKEDKGPHLNMAKVFNLDGAINELTATYWNKALKLTGLDEEMPQERRSQWWRSLNAWRNPRYKKGESPELDMPEFSLDNLRATIQSLISRRAEFLAERVDGIFRALSQRHVTNTPEAFQKRMILNGVFDKFGFLDYQREGYIHDLRLVIAKFMGRDEPSHVSSKQLLMLAKAKSGEWVEVDGGSLRIRAYKVGTAHLEIHPDMAIRLNGILSFLYPAAIPESTYTRKKRTLNAKNFKEKPLFDKVLPSQVCNFLINMERYYILTPSTDLRKKYNQNYIENTLGFYRHHDTSKHLLDEVSKVLIALGGTLYTCEKNSRNQYWKFDYNPDLIIKEVALSGCIPDMKSYQFYPTPQPVSEQLIDWLQIQPSDSCLEPQAGQGGIADLLPKDQTLCVEISPLHCAILREKGHKVVEGDFLGWNPKTLFNVVACNPPYSEGRWQEHLRHAGTLVEDGGRLGAVLPLSAKQKAAQLLPQFDLEFSEPIDNAFSGTSISVLLLKATRKTEPKNSIGLNF